jgi:hypothetical protein
MRPELNIIGPELIVANTLIVLGGVILLFGAAGVTIGLVLRSRRR